MISRKGQTAMEYLMIIALTLGIIVPTAYLFFRYSSESNVQIIDSQITQIGRTIIDTAQTVYFSGEGSKIIIDINMPEKIDDAYILANRELVFEIISEISDIGETQAVFFSTPTVSLTSIPVGICPSVEGVVKCDLSDIVGPGLLKLRIQAISDGNGGTQILIQKA